MLSRRTLSVVIVILVAALASPIAWCAEETHEGKVLAVGDGRLMILDLKDDDTDTFVVTAETKISRNGKSVKLSDLQPGDVATVTATSAGGMLMAKEISARTPM